MIFAVFVIFDIFQVFNLNISNIYIKTLQFALHQLLVVKRSTFHQILHLKSLKGTVVTAAYLIDGVRERLKILKVFVARNL